MTVSRRLRRSLAVVLVSALPSLAVPAADPATVTLRGHVVAPSGSPLAGAVVHVADPRTGDLVASRPTGSDGAFEAGALRPAAYALGVESEGKLFVVDSPVTLAPGQTRTVTVALPAHAAMEPSDQADPEAAKDAFTWWNNPLVASLVVVTGAIVLGILIDQATDDDPKASPSAP